MKAAARHEPSGRSRSRDLRQLSGLLMFIRPYHWRIAGAGVGLLTGTGALLLFGAGLRSLVDRGISDQSATTLDRVLVTMFGVAAILALATMARSYFITTIGERVAADIRRAAYDHVLGLNSAFFEGIQTGELVSRITADTLLVQTVFGSTTSLALRNIFMLVGGLTMMMLTSPTLTGFAILIVIAIIVPTVSHERRRMTGFCAKLGWVELPVWGNLSGSRGRG
jgi:ATP-binding cassette, subfamily B, bacterial